MWQFILDNIWSILSILVAIVGVIVGRLFPNTKLAKGLNIFANAIKSLPTFIRQAEKVSSDPSEREAFVIDQFTLFCKAAGYTPTEEQLLEISVIITDLVKLTKDINIQSKATTDTTTTTPTIKPIATIGGGIHGDK